jgi:hypothetical protein
MVEEGRSGIQALREVLYGLFAFDLEQGLRAEALQKGDIFLALTVGHLLGLPLHTSYYSLRILPHVFGDLPVWRRRTCRERWVL